MATSARGWVNTLRQSHDHLAGVMAGLNASQVAGPSYCSEWSVAQVLSHLGSGAEIGLANLEAMLAGDPPPARERYQEIWARWDAKSPADMAADALVSDEAHVSRLEGLPDAQLAGLSTQFMGRTLDAAGIIGMRLAEHSVHTWDVESTVDPGATIQQSAVNLVVDLLPGRMGRLANGKKPQATPFDIDIHASAPERLCKLSVTQDAVEMSPETGTPAGSLDLSSEALIRLTYGRLDP
ncbi:MAG: maleylpyruvate isomerase N-terminal domain-containing protein, partial [Acidimicrobiaceae bacterium]|nr:maleylpyruvate isomerase N-terminal domain-containing protein [Acidimicrobiaceae bacterium]